MAFFGCTGLTSISIPNSVTHLGKQAFSNCTGLTSATIGNGLTDISFAAFYQCTGLTSLTLGSGLTSIGNAAFALCSGLTTVTIPDNVTDIVAAAFFGCPSLTTVTIGKGVKTIGKGAFGDCMSLADVYCLAEAVPATDDEDPFAESSVATATLHVPTASVDAYKSTAPWSSFKEVVAITAQDAGISGIAGEIHPATVRYTLGGRRTNHSEKGLTIFRTPDGSIRKAVVK